MKIKDCLPRLDKFLPSALATVMFLIVPAAAQLTINEDLVVGTDPDPNGWDYTDEDIGIGVGAGQSGSLTVPAGETLPYLNLSLGVGAADAQGTMTITGAGASAISSRSNDDFDSDFLVGEDGIGNLSITDGGFLGRRLIHVGFNSGSEGTVDVDGADSVLGTAAGNWALRVGQAGTGTLNVTNGATVQNVFTLFVGNQATGDGTMNVSGGSAFTTTGASRIANLSGSTGKATISGEGSTFTSGSFLHVGRFGTGSLVVEDGAELIVESNFVLGRESPGNGQMQVTGENTSADVEGYIYVGWDGEATLLVDEGASIESGGSLRLGRGDGSVGEATVTGAGTSVVSNDFIHVGGEGQGTLNIEDGGLVHTTGSVSVSRESGSRGDVVVSGENSVFSSGTWFRVGRFDDGTLLVNDGGRVEVGDGDFTVGSAVGALGVATVTGAGSQITSGENFRIGFNGIGELNILDGGFARSDTQTAVGQNSGSSGVILVDGTGSVLSVGTDLLMGANWEVIEGEPDQIIVSEGDSIITVQNGGQVNVAGDAYMRGESLLHLDGGDFNVAGIFDAGDADSILRFTLNNPGNGTLFADSALLDGLNLEITLAHQPELDDVFVLLEAANGISGLLSFGGSSLSEGGMFTAATGAFEQMFSISYSHGGGDVIALTAIPEPSTWAFITGLAMAALLFLRRRKA